ncbi:hypothetical protein NPIL_206491 [Nephila pilipes]|uniref:Uncharacterized protein n=1 Tax=Nephila pilipes TaxID=299642 RepID=A0A8X6QJC1_NEPPI|nr:hypothetical protein NPIL_206491 [Nephila pilipes]
MGWMAGKEHSSGPVIQAHTPPSFGFLPLPTLGQMPFTNWKRPGPLAQVSCFGALIFQMDQPNATSSYRLPITAGYSTSRVIICLELDYFTP